MKHNYKELKTWQQSRILVKEIYLITKNFPKEELFGLTNQMRRAAVSIPSNIAEGFGRGTNPQIRQFLNIAQGSLFELETQVLLSFDLEYLTTEQLADLSEKITNISKMIDGLANKYQ